MFVDVCFPNENEQEFMRMAERLSTAALCFVYASPQKSRLFDKKKTCVYSAVMRAKGKNMLSFSDRFPEDVKKSRNSLFFVRSVGKNRNFHSPSCINHVAIKELAAGNNALGIGYSLIKDAKREPAVAEQVSFLFRLCKKYNAITFAASFAASPYEMRSEKEIFGTLYSINKDAHLVKRSLGALNDIIRDFEKSKGF